MCNCQLAYQDVLASTEFMYVHLFSVHFSFSLALSLSLSVGARLMFAGCHSCISTCSSFWWFFLCSFIYCVYESEMKNVHYDHTEWTKWKIEELKQIINYKSYGSDVERVKVHWILKTIGVVFIFILPLNFVLCILYLWMHFLLFHESWDSHDDKTGEGETERKTKGSVSVLYFNR